MSSIAVIGAGEMGHGIAEVFALGGHEVRLVDVEQKFIDRGMERIRESLSRMAKKGDLSEKGLEEVLGRISSTTDLAVGVAAANLVVEAVPELPELKEEVFRQLEKNAPPDAILGTNTSNIRISEIAAKLQNPERVVGIHFFNPAVVMKLVEVVKGEKTSDVTVETVRKMLADLKKTPVIVRKDTPGFVVNRINAAELLLFGLIQDTGLATPEQVDAFARSQGLPMGPYELIDYVGVDVVKNSLDYYARELSEDYGRCRIFNELFAEKRLGKKSGRGFYDWSSGRPNIDSSRATDRLSLMDLFAIEINEAVKLLEEGVATPDEIETAVRLGMNRPFGPVSVAKSLTNAEVKGALERLSSQFSMPLFSPAASIRDGRMREAVEGRLSAPGRKEEAAAESAAAQGTTLLVEEHGAVARIVINRPKYNMINMDVLSDLEKAIDSLWNRREIRVVLVTGAGANFSSGAEMSAFIPGGTEFMEYARRGGRIFRKLSEMPKITIAAMKGYVLGGGFELALACDLRVCSPDTKMGLPEVTRGLVPVWGGTQMLTKLVGASRAMSMILTAERMGSEAAAACGLVARVMDNIDESSLAFAGELASSSAPVSSVLVKRLVGRAAEGSSDAGLEMESFAAGVVFGTEDLREGIGAFLQKRKAEFKGK